MQVLLGKSQSFARVSIQTKEILLLSKSRLEDWISGTCIVRSVADPKQKYRIRLRIRIRPEVSFGSGSGFGSGFESGFESRIRIRILDQDQDQKLAKFFFVLKFLRSLIFKAALHQFCDLVTNKVRKKLAIYEDLTHTYMHIVCV